MLLQLVFLQLFITHPITSIDSYIYLNDKIIQEELPVGSFILDLNDELSTLPAYSQASSEQFTFLDDLNTHAGSKTYFLLDLLTGRVTSKRYLDREAMCAHRHCSNSCTSNQTYCKLNLKILLMPSSNIISLNVLVQDINDNKPLFRRQRLEYELAENVPLGHRIPLELAYDPDAGANSIIKYDLLSPRDPLPPLTFQLVYDSKEPQLYLSVINSLDRELKPEYNLTLVAYDGGIPSFSGHIDLHVRVLDINDNSPLFTRQIYRFYLFENETIDALIGAVQAHDPDEGTNSQLTYTLVGNTRNTSANYFLLNSITGELRLNRLVDYEDESYFNLVVEARDSGLGSLPAYATVELYILDVNDNRPEIAVSFLSTLKRDSHAQLTIYLNENCEQGKFIAHISISDKDSHHIKWSVLGIDVFFNIILLNNNSFTLNTGVKQLDRETRTHFNVCIQARDTDFVTFYNFTIRLLDTNDNSPYFEKSSYSLAMYENNSPGDIITQMYARDVDESENARLSYEILDCAQVDIDSNGVLRARIMFDRELSETYNFTVYVRDNGIPPLSSKVSVSLRILDRNDNSPKIDYTLTNVLELNENLTTNRTLYLTTSNGMLNTHVGKSLVKFFYTDTDTDLNAKSLFRLVNFTSSNFGQKLVFRVTHDGKLIIVQRLVAKFDIKFYLFIVCENENALEVNSSLNVVISIAFNGGEQIHAKNNDFNEEKDDTEMDEYYFFNDIDLNPLSLNKSMISSDTTRDLDGHLVLLLFILVIIILVTFISLVIMIYFYKKYKSKLMPLTRSSVLPFGKHTSGTTALASDCLYFKNDSANQLLLGNSSSSTSTSSGHHRLSLSLQSTKSDQSTSITDSFVRELQHSKHQSQLYANQSSSLLLDKSVSYVSRSTSFRAVPSDYDDDWSAFGQQSKQNKFHSFKSSQV